MFGERLRELRKSKKLTAKQFGEKFNLAESTISGYETGARKPDIELVRSFAQFFGVTTDYLLGVSDTPDLTEKDEKDIAKRMEQIRKDLTDEDGLTFYGEPMSEEAIESFLEAMEYAVRTTKRINKKYIPKKYRKEDNE